MDITPIIQTLHNKTGKTIRVLKKEITAGEKGPIISKKVKSIVYDRNLTPLSCKETTWSRGKIIQADVYQKTGKEGIVLKQGIGKNIKKTILQHLNLEEIASNFLK